MIFNCKVYRYMEPGPTLVPGVFTLPVCAIYTKPASGAPMWSRRSQTSRSLLNFYR